MTGPRQKLASLAVGLLTTAMLGCGAPAERGAGGVATSIESVLAGADHSIYHLDDTWLDQSGRERRLGSLHGRPQVVTMVYLSCGHACPRLLLDLKRIEAEIGDQHDIGFVMVSIDAVRDTPDRLAEYAAGARLDARRWTLLTADDRAVRGLAALLGVRYSSTRDGEFSHSNVITVLDAQGVVVHRQVGLGEDPAATLAALRLLVERKRS